MINLRWFSMCNGDGVWTTPVRTTPVLQYWDEDDHRWQDVPTITCKTWEEEEFLHNEFAM